MSTQTRRSRVAVLGPGDDADSIPEPTPDYRRVHHRLAVANRLATRLAPVLDPLEVCRATVDELHVAFDYYFAVVQRLDPDGVLRVVAGAGPLTADSADYLAWEQPIDTGVNGRVARTGQPALVPDTRHDPDYLRRDPRSDPGSELSVPIHVAGEVWGVLNLEEVATGAFDETDLLLADTVAAQVGAALHRAALTRELENAFGATLGMLSDVLETKDAYTAHHADEVKLLAERVAERLGVTGEALRRVQYGALLHDIGKIGVPSELLGKPGPLDPDERKVMERHSEIGADLLARIPFFAEVAPLVRWSHERWDGGGYPDGLTGEQTPLGARIVAACDAFHAMTSDRPYRSALPVEVAVDELNRGAGTQFDPAVVEALVEVTTPQRAGGG
jgi:putative nucleotidyltransferase with HDIG domain